MIKLFAVTLILLISLTSFAQKRLDLSEYDNAPQTVLLTDYNESFPIKLFGDYQLKGSILSSKDFLLTRFSATGQNIVRDGYSSTGFMSVDGAAIRSQIRYNHGRYAKKKGFSVRNMLLNRPRQGFIQGLGLNTNFFTPIR